MLTKDDFTGQIFIKDLFGNSPSNEGFRQYFEEFRSDYETRFLKTLFNSDFYADYLSGIVLGAQKWTDLEALLKKPCARFVYFNFVKENTTQSTPAGEVQANVDNASIVSNVPKLVSQWNKMSEECQEVYDFLATNESDYPTFDLSQTFLTNGQHPFRRISLIG